MHTSFTHDKSPPEIDISQFLFNQDSKRQSIIHEEHFNEVRSVDDNSTPYFAQNVSLEQSLFRSATLNTFQITPSNDQFPIFSQSFNQSQSDFDNDDDSPEKGRKEPSKNKVYARNYRQKKKQRMKNLEEQNRYLKSKIDDLSFRLKQTQLQLNKLKHNHTSNNQNFHITKESFLKEIQRIVQTQEHTNLETLKQVQKKMREAFAFQSKHKMDLLNYFMNELLQNLINDFGLYFLDCITERSGFWKAFDYQQAKRIDLEIADLLGEKGFEHMKQSIQVFPQLAVNHMKNFKLLWKKLYDDYINIINQGIMVQTLCQPLQQNNRRENYKDKIIGYFKLELYFEKIKYRKDMRQLRESWFHSTCPEEEEARTNRLKIVCKKIKVGSEQ